MKHIITTLFILVTISAFAQEKVEKNYQLEDPIKELKVNGFNDVVFVLAEEYSVTVEYYNGEGFNYTSFVNLESGKKTSYSLKQKGKNAKKYDSRIVISGPLDTIKEVKIKNVDSVYFPEKWQGDEEVNLWYNDGKVDFIRNYTEKK